LAASLKPTSTFAIAAATPKRLGSVDVSEVDRKAAAEGADCPKQDRAATSGTFRRRLRATVEQIQSVKL
jgi:hypothetical protein